MYWFLIERLPAFSDSLENGQRASMSVNTSTHVKPCLIPEQWSSSEYHQIDAERFHYYSHWWDNQNPCDIYTGTIYMHVWNRNSKHFECCRWLIFDRSVWHFFRIYQWLMNPFKLFFKTSYDNATWVRDILDETPINLCMVG